jgi:hypothetical protein
MTMKKTLPEKNLLSLSFLGYEEIKFKRFLSGRLCIMVKKKLIDYFKCVYFLLSRAPFGRSHYLAPVALGFLIMRKIFLVGNLFLLTCPSQCWSEHTAFFVLEHVWDYFSICQWCPPGLVITVAYSATCNQPVHTYWSAGWGMNP